MKNMHFIAISILTLLLSLLFWYLQHNETLNAKSKMQDILFEKNTICLDNSNELLEDRKKMADVYLEEMNQIIPVNYKNASFEEKKILISDNSYAYYTYYIDLHFYWRDIYKIVAIVFSAFFCIVLTYFYFKKENK